MLKPDEFYELSIRDYPIMQLAHMDKVREYEYIQRRSAFIVGASSYQGKDNYAQWFNNVWPLPGEVQESIDDKVTRLRKQGQRDALWLTQHAEGIRQAVERGRKEKAEKDAKKKQDKLEKRLENGNRRTKDNSRG